MEQLIKHIYRRLAKKEWRFLPSKLKGGKMGLAVFFALYSDSFSNNSSRKLSAKILYNLLQDISLLPYGLVSGKMGIAWSLYLLYQRGILEKDEPLDDLFKSIRREYIYRQHSKPVQLIAGDDLFSEGIYMLRQRNTDSLLERYSVDEGLIGLVDECERQLTQSIKYIYRPEDMSLSRLHSILFFLTQISEKKIYPYKANALLCHVKERFVQMKEKPLCDEYIYHFLMQDDKAIVPINLEDRNLFLLIGELGFYSLLYDNQGIFWSAWQQVEEKYPGFKGKAESIIKAKSTPVAALCGWGYGLLQCKTESYV